MNTFLYIPWFQAKPWPIDLPLVGEVNIQPFGVLVAIAVIVGAKVSELHGRKHHIQPEYTTDLVMHIVITGFIVSPIFNGIFYETELFLQILKNPSLAFSSCVGISSMGGFLGAFLGALIWKWRTKQEVIPVVDSIAFGAPFGYFFGRMGCFVVHDHPGKVTDFPLAVADYQVGLPPFEPRHDLGFYEMLWLAAIAGIFLIIEKFKPPRGLFIALLPTLYAPIRFLLDFLRADVDEGGDNRVFGLTPGQYSAVALLGLGIALFVIFFRKQKQISPST